MHKLSIFFFAILPLAAHAANPLILPESIACSKILYNTESMTQQENCLTQKLAESGVTKPLIKQMLPVFSAFIQQNCLLALKVTNDFELGENAAIKIDVSPDLQNYVQAFAINYKYFLDFLHIHVYQKTKISSLQVPCLLLFRGGSAMLPIIKLTTAPMDHKQVEQIVRKKLQEPLTETKTILQQYGL